ncbi:MAG: hypothetical protein JW946_06225 [Candidatus Omnitrophica bacterium]|nr:hypothetical protein [Candidatus Omnitrophota bacterium]
MNENAAIKLSFYGLGVEIKSSSAQTIEAVKKDFSFFKSKNTDAQVKIEIFLKAPDYKNLPSVTASVYTPRNICYRQGNISYIDYFGKGLSIIDTSKSLYSIYSDDEYLSHEMAYLTIMSIVGQYLDSKSIHRVHGLGLDINGKAVLILLPKGGGKTTLLLNLLKEKNVKLISEDSPLIDKNSNILPFPIRIGVSCEEKPFFVDEKYLTFVKRMEFEPKYLIDIEAFKDKISDKASKPWIILLGERSLGNESKITPASKSKAFGEFVKNSVIGLGLYQGVEFILQKSPWELLGKTGLLYSRFRNAAKVISKSKTYTFTLGCDISKNSATLLELLKTRE